MSAARLSDMLNIRKTFSFEGRDYDLDEADIQQRGEFAAWVEERALEYIYRAQLNDIEGRFSKMIEMMLDKHVKAVAAGQYEWGGEPVLEATKTMEGQCKLLHILLKRNHPEITEEIAKHMMEQKYKEVAEKVREAFTDPKLSSELADIAAMLISSNS